MKTIIVDTNVLLSDSNALFAFEENEVVLPLIVLEELDRQKDRQDEVGKNARETTRKLILLTSDHKDLKTGIPLPNTGILRVLSVSDFSNTPSIPTEIQEKSGDNTILSLCLAYMKEYPTKKVVLVTRDILLRIKAISLGIVCEDYKKLSVAASLTGLYTGIKIIENDEFVQRLYEGNLFFDGEYTEQNKLHPNQYLVLKGNSSSALGRYIGPSKPIRQVKQDKPISKITARNKEQQFAYDALLDPSIELVTLAGPSGTGKTLLALAAGLHQVLDTKRYKSLVVCRPVVSVGKDIGYLPGPQPLDAKVLTPTGWTTMGKLKTGDQVISRDGKPTKVLGIYPKGVKSVYKISTNDNCSTECCGDHLWLTTTILDRIKKRIGSVKSTAEILDTIKNPYRPSQNNHRLPRNEPVEFCSTSLPIPPYTLGALLGDGSLSKKAAVEFINNDAEIIERINKELTQLDCTLSHKKNLCYCVKSKFTGGSNFKPIKLTNINTNETIIYPTIFEALKNSNLTRSGFSQRCWKRMIINGWQHEFLPKEKRWLNPVKQILDDINVLGTHAETKFIPTQYKYNSITNRIALLQGLMDTDGTINKNGHITFCTTSKQLAIDLIEVVRSLGGRAIIQQRNRINKTSFIGNRKLTTRLISYEFTISMPENINPFFVSRKASRYKTNPIQKRYKNRFIRDASIKSIEYIGEKEVQCISVDNPEHLYITDDFIVTHNTIEEKMNPWLSPLHDNLRYLLSDGGKKTKSSDETLQFLFDNGTIEIQVMSYIRGRSIANAFMIIDEGQNVSPSEIKTIITRAGEGTKMCIIGDLNQIDTPYNDSLTCGLSKAIETFKDYPIAAHISLTTGCRSVLATLAAQILG